MKSILEAMERVVLDGGLVLLLIGGVSLIAWLLLFLKWVHLRSISVALDAGRPERVRLSRQMLQVWNDGEQGHLFGGMGPIEASAALLPLLGLLGTVMGMLQTFEVIQAEGTGDPRLMANGIRKALLTTQAGILAAVPVLIGLRVVASRASRLGARIENSLFGSATQLDHGVEQ